MALTNVTVTANDPEVIRVIGTIFQALRAESVQPGDQKDIEAYLFTQSAMETVTPVYADVIQIASPYCNITEV